MAVLCDEIWPFPLMREILDRVYRFHQGQAAVLKYWTHAAYQQTTEEHV